MKATIISATLWSYLPSPADAARTEKLCLDGLGHVERETHRDGTFTFGEFTPCDGSCMKNDIVLPAEAQQEFDVFLAKLVADKLTQFKGGQVRQKDDRDDIVGTIEDVTLSGATIKIKVSGTMKWTQTPPRDKDEPLPNPWQPNGKTGMDLEIAYYAVTNVRTKLTLATRDGEARTFTFTPADHADNVKFGAP